jgi:hypothetical protein
MPSPTATLTFVYQDPSGAPIAGGTVTFLLSYDLSTATSGGVQVSAGRKVSATLDGNGSCTVTLYRTDILSPAGAVYDVRVYTAKGQPCYNEQITVT